LKSNGADRLFQRPKEALGSPIAPYLHPGLNAAVAGKDSEGSFEISLAYKLHQKWKPALGHSTLADSVRSSAPDGRKDNWRDYSDPPMLVSPQVRISTEAPHSPYF
jgi:hypothetical protein